MTLNKKVRKFDVVLTNNRLEKKENTLLHKHYFIYRFCLSIKNNFSCLIKVNETITVHNPTNNKNPNART